MMLFSFCRPGSSYAESEGSFLSGSFSLLYKFQKDFGQDLLNLHPAAADAGEVNIRPFSKKGKKGIKPTLSCFVDESFLEIIYFNIAWIYSPERFYLFCPYFGDDERGPPALLVF